MKMVLIGHRGVGKTSLLQRLQIYNTLFNQEVSVFDLDREIERSTGSKISEIFELVGEKVFREMELKTFQLLAKKNDYIISLGAGFPFKQIEFENDVEVVWIRRASDSNGRIFLDRPRLDKTKTAIEEFHVRFKQREQIYEEKSHWVYDLPEGLMQPSEAERMIFLNQISGIGGGLTILPKHAKNFEIFKKRYWRWDFDYFELRDDLLNKDQCQKFLAILAKNEVLLSFRNDNPPEELRELFMNAVLDGYRSDWALELDVPSGSPHKKSEIISLHKRNLNESVSAVTKRLELATAQSSQHLKLAIEINNYDELYEGLRWQMENPTNRSFLPRSNEGRWNWVRLWLKDRQSLNFIREGLTHDGVEDQPTMTEWLTCPEQPQQFAAVLGDPVKFSYSPSEHRTFFKFYQAPFFAIDIAINEWAMAMEVLQKMGLKYAAVTAPLKEKAFEFSTTPSLLAQSLKSVNTLMKVDKDWVSENTDFEGLNESLRTLGELGDTIVWGGQGTLPAIRKVLPNAQCYSMRTGRPRAGAVEILPRTLIWAAPPDGNLPPPEWKPERVYDLNYQEASLAKEYCQRVGAGYISGLPMFKIQAEAQRTFWERKYGG